MRATVDFLLAALAVSLLGLPARAAGGEPAPAGGESSPAPPVHLFILSGQSNMAGLDPDASFTPAVREALPGAEVLVVKDAQDAQPIRRWHKKWKPARGEPPPVDGKLYDQLMLKVRKATAKGTKPATVTFVWMQGERDAKESHGEVYAASLAGLIAQLREDLGRQDVNVVIGRLSDFAGKGYPHWTMVREAQVKVAEADPRAGWVDTDDLNGEKNDLHYTKPEGYAKLGERFSAKALELLRKGGTKTEPPPETTPMPAPNPTPTPTPTPPPGGLAKPVGAADKPAGFSVRRFEGNPIVRPEMLPGKDGENINGPSLIRVPAWVEKPLGKYYLYFAHHGGGYIRLAYADKLEGPWKIHEPGVQFQPRNERPHSGHVASPDVIVDEEKKELRLYYHSFASRETKAEVEKAGRRIPSNSDSGGQVTFVAVSRDGLTFTPRREVLGLFYFRVFRWDGWWYAMAKAGLLYRSKDGLGPFEEGPNPLSHNVKKHGPSPRHVAVLVQDGKLRVYYSNIGDTPERILRCAIDLAGDWKDWRPSPPEEVLRPEKDYEGADLPVTRSRTGATQRVHALRDPALFVEDGRTWLLYSVAGESGIAMAEICEETKR